MSQRRSAANVARKSTRVDRLRKPRHAPSTVPTEGDKTPPLRTGDVVDRYQVQAVLGAGVRGFVFTAFDPDLDRTVALKLIGDESEAEVLREAQAVARLKHPNVVTVYDVGTDRGHVFVAMELIDGLPLGAWLAAGERPWRAIRDVFLAAGRGLAAAHAAGIAHGDFKPSNVIVGANRVVVVGFGVGTPASGDALADQKAFAGAMRSALNPGTPQRVADALARALSPEPSHRWPSLANLLAELGRDPAAARRRVIVRAVAGLLVAAVIAAAFILGRKAALRDPCGGADATIAGVWDEATREKTREAFRRTGRPYADETFVHVDGLMQQRLADWARAHRDACEATEVRHEQSPELLDARMACLGRARTEIAAMASLLPQADAAALDRAATAAGKLGDLAACADLVALGHAVPPPRDASVAHEIGELRDEIGRLAALRALGRLKEGLELGPRLVERARAAGYAPVLAAALDKTTYFEVAAGKNDDALAHAYEEARVAAEARDDSLVALAMSTVMFVLGNNDERFEAAEVAYQSAENAAARAGNPGIVLERLYHDRTGVLYLRGDFLNVLPLCQIAYGLSVHLNGADSAEAAVSLGHIADAMSALGDAGAASAIYRRALATAELALAPEHPTVLDIVNNAGVNRLDVYDFDGAAPYFQRALVAYEKIYGENDAGTAFAAHNLGMARRGQRRLTEARALFERAIRIRLAELGADHPLLATSYGELAEVDRLEGRRDDALADLDREIAIQRRAYAAPHPWLAESYLARAGVLLEIGRIHEADLAHALAKNILAKAGGDPMERGLLFKVDGDIRAAERRPREAVALYRQALPFLEIKLGHNGPGLIAALLGLGAAELDAGDTADAGATAERVVAIETYNRAPADLAGAAQFLLARTRWQKNQDRPGAVVLARAARAQLAALPYPTATVPEIDRWLARK